MNTAYKILSRTKRGLTSFIWFSANSLIYPPTGEWVEPKIKGSKLFCFKELEDAEALFEWATGENELWLCAYEGDLVKIDRCLDIYRTDSPLLIKEFFLKTNFGTGALEKTPHGTYGVDKLKLIKRLK